MFMMQSLGIQAPVGHGPKARNSPQDVQNVQRLLNDRRQAGPALTVDGKCGPKTIGAIMAFQKQVVRLNNPDGRVDPAGKTIAALNDPANRLSIPTVPMTPAGPAGAGGGGQNSPVADAIRQQMAQDGAAPPIIDEWLAWWEQDGANLFKSAGGLIGRGEDARVIGKLIALLRANGFSPRDVGNAFRNFAKLSGSDFAKFAEWATEMQGNGPFAKLIKDASGPAAKLGIVVALIDSIAHIKRGDFGPGLAEIYKALMGARVPWAAMLDGIGSLADALMGVSGSDYKNSRWYQVARAFDPIGLGAVAVDSFFSIYSACLDAALQRDWNAMQPGVERLVKRIKDSPAAAFARYGEWQADVWWYVFEQIEQISIADLEQFLRFGSLETFWDEIFAEWKGGDWRRL